MTGATRTVGDLANIPLDTSKPYNWTTGTGWTPAYTGFSYFSEAQSATAPNATVPVNALKVAGTQTNIDLVIGPKGTGSIATQVADGATTGGNKRGLYAVDFQSVRSAATQVASGTGTLLVGRNSTASGNLSAAIGSACTASGGTSLAVGNSCTASGGQSFAGGNLCAAAGAQSFTFGYGNQASGDQSFSVGTTCNADGVASIATGSNALARGMIGANARSVTAPVGGPGTQQDRNFRLIANTISATATPMLADTGTSASVANTLNLVANCTYLVKGLATARDATGTSAAWEIVALVKQGATASTTALVGTPTVVALFKDASASAWAPTVTVDTSLGTINFNAAGSTTTTSWSFSGISVETVL